ncbi:TVP38 [Candida pseudojiufengensis]|uniref:TVP38 n=1 Tax=Candida pseudojiufengensis TaxID=497109 RepID=UPI0022255296|nr:TVP38 [Candida pseudojiufengensis]KAI5963121.1 TVP38 [Candida pseudojiufengensis]
MPHLPSTDSRVNYDQFRNTPTLRETIAQKVASLIHTGKKFKEWFIEQSIPIKALLVFGFIILVILGTLFIIFHSYFIRILISISNEWHDLKYGNLIIFSLIFIVGFPPLIGFSALSFLTGMIYGFPQGWPILASAAVAGSTASFLIFRYFLNNQANKLMAYNENFKAFAEILNEDNSLLLLILIRLCPLPYSLSNGALAAIPNLPITTYVLATIITSPKLLIHLFVGAKLKDLGDNESSTTSKIVDIISIIITGSAATLVTYIIYNKMQIKLASFRQRGFVNDDVLVFGNFDDDLEMGSHNEIELNSADYDTDNFIINEDEEDVDNESNIQADDRSHKSQSSK